MLIGINGNIGAGKDTVGEYLNQEYGYERLSFAAKLKESAASLFDIHPAMWESWKNLDHIRVRITNEDYPDEFEADMSVRTFLQRYGTEAHRDIFGDDFWVDHALRGVDPNKNYYFTDARFANELRAIKELGGYTVRVERDLETTDTHASEQRPPFELIDYQLDNTGTLEDLYENVDYFMSWIKYEELQKEAVGSRYGDE